MKTNIGGMDMGMVLTRLLTGVGAGASSHSPEHHLRDSIALKGAGTSYFEPKRDSRRPFESARAGTRTFLPKRTKER